ncbi:efflux RND transporter periplasmic adaptor subunit [Geofilum sp. OHC36d9]|uniref:efflux RND transporter periplasmic adaptor subunit n=1 Tax=Geofilum sp. OHC36d9 TaxID=3458413 RepID=UPI004034E7AA
MKNQFVKMQNKKRNRWVLIAGVAIVAIVLAFWFFKGPSIVGDVLVEAKVQRGNFVAEVHSTGQLQAENSTSIDVPTELSSRRINIFEIKITDLVEEGTVVKAGDFVASLDHSAVEEIMNTAEDELEKSLQALQDARIDTNINMSNLRDGLLDARMAVEEQKLVLEQSVYESPAVKRQAGLDLERAEKNLEQSLRNYELKEQQARNSVARAMEEVKKDRERVQDIERLFKALDVRAPKPGMVIYSYDRFGSKIQVGSSVSRWMPRIAELPDLSSMISKTYINEIDISKVAVGQKVQVGVDAFPDKHFDGEVISVANIGQTLPNGDTKVFEVVIKIFGTDPDLRPAMTTSNVITVQNLEDVLFVPLESVFKTDSMRYVFTYKKNELVKQIIDPGLENDNFVVVNEGLQENQTVLLNAPFETEHLTLEGIDIYNKIKEKALKAQEEATRKKAEPKAEKRPVKPRGEFPGGNARRR